MLVRYWMSRNLVTIEEKESMQKAMVLMNENRVRMLPVMRKGKLVGVVSSTDLKRASASDATVLGTHELVHLISKIKVNEIMAKNPVSVPEDFTVEETAQILLEHNISGVPVMDHEGKLAGVITRYDVFKILISLSGLGRHRGIQFAFLIEDKSGSIKAITDVILRFGGRIASILSSNECPHAGKHIVYIRVFDFDRAKLPDLIRELREKGTLIYLVDHRLNTRKIYEDIVA